MKEVTKERKRGRNSKEGFTEMNKDKKMENNIGSEMIQAKARRQSPATLKATLKLGRILKKKATLKVEDNKDTKNCVDDDNYLLRDTLSWLIFCLKERQEFCQSTYLLIEKSIVVVKIKYYILIYANSAEEQHT